VTHPLQNPVLPGFHPDPSVCRVGDDYFLVTSSFEYFPGVPIFHSCDLAHWRPLGHVLSRESQLDLSAAWTSGGIYAPTLRHHDGRFYLITTNTSGAGNFFVTAADPAGPWSDPVWLDKDGIDPDLFFDDDGTVYYTLSGRTGGPCRIVQSTIDIATGRKLTPPREIWRGTGGLGPEGPHLYKIDGRYYLMIAEGGTEYGHMETLARGPSPSGPWEPCPHNPILTHRSLGHPVQATGHADLVQTPDGAWFLVCLGIRPYGYHRVHNLGRETFLAPVSWTPDGWPVVGQGGTVPLEIPADRLPPTHPWPEPPTRDEFDGRRLAHHWNFIRNPAAENYSLTRRPGALTLVGAPAGLDDMDRPTWLGRRQQHHECTAATALEFDPAADGDEAGLTAFQNVRHHYEIALVRRAGQRRLLTRRRVGSLFAESPAVPAPPGPVRLRVRADRDLYRFEFSPDGRAWTTLGEGESRYLSTEVGGRFTGVYLALYATGNGRPASAPAFFDFFEYRPTAGP
jgi:alpha-N-arabinofuranosidase